MDKDPTPRPLYKSLYAQVITAIIIGVILGHFWPQVGESMKPLGDGFIKLIKMIIAPIIFCTVVVGIAGMEDMKKVGKTGGLALLYFEIVSSIALIVGLVIINIVQPGAGMNVDAELARHQAGRGLHRARQDAGNGRLPAGDHPEHGGRRLRQGRDPAGAAVRGAVRLRAAQVRRPRHARLRRHREDVARPLLDRRHHHAGGADRRLRRDGVHDRQVRHRLADVARQADGNVLRDVPLLHLRRPRPDRPLPRLLDLEVHQVHQGGAADRPRHVELGVGAAADDGQDGEPRRQEVGGRPGDPDRLLVQPRRHLDLPDDGRRLHRPGDQHADDARPAGRRCSRCCC